MALRKTRTTRFSEKELERIRIFLEQNPFLDFSTLARLAISNFIENPEVKVLPLSKKPKKVAECFEKGAH